MAKYLQAQGADLNWPAPWSHQTPGDIAGKALHSDIVCLACRKPRRPRQEQRLKFLHRSLRNLVYSARRDGVGLHLQPMKRKPREHAMIKVSVMYPNTPGARFDHAYYKDKHMPLVKARLGEACKFYTVDKGIAGGAPGAPATYVAMCHIFCDSVEAFQAGFGPHAKEIMGDIPNYTDLAPVIQISDVVVGRP
jgi:uncharacterized protein (TIGR02118 family)